MTSLAEVQVRERKADVNFGRLISDVITIAQFHCCSGQSNSEIMRSK